MLRHSQCLHPLHLFNQACLSVMSDPSRISQHACQVKRILSSVDKPGELDAIIEAVPQLLDPRQLALSLSNLARWFPSQHPVEVRLARRGAPCCMN